MMENVDSLTYCQEADQWKPKPWSEEQLLLFYDYEVQSSTAGSVGCCSFLESDSDLQFLDDLGPKFKTLAEMCSGKTIPSEVKKVFTPLPTASINTQTSVSSLVTVPQVQSPAKLQSTVPTVEQTVVRETSERSQMVKESTATVRGKSQPNPPAAAAAACVLHHHPCAEVNALRSPATGSEHHAVG
ncbi:desmoglein-2-like isoform X2 [Toxotes jaculatrix]|nr:desmoglein-2-like isoform X2 [Toxotes jaculatrix]